MQPRVGRPRLIFVLLAWLGGATVCFAQDAARMDQVVQSYVSNGTFAGSVLVARGSHVIVSKGYGLANVEWNIPSSPSARFRVASITKQFTAAAILLLEERGQLNRIPGTACDRLRRIRTTRSTTSFAAQRRGPDERRSTDGTLALKPIRARGPLLDGDGAMTTWSRPYTGKKSSFRRTATVRE